MGPELLALSVLGMMACTMPLRRRRSAYTMTTSNSHRRGVSHIGDTIKWVSAEFVAHTATSRNKDWDVVITAKGTGRVTLQHAGEVGYFCRFHPNMTGRISVAGPQ